MTVYTDFSKKECRETLPVTFDVIVIGCGAAGLTLAREMSGRGLRIALLESGALEEDATHEELNAVDVSEPLDDPAWQKIRSKAHAYQMKFWNTAIQKFGVRCRVFGGSTAAWAGKVAPFDALDYAQRAWIPFSGWPVTAEEMEPYMHRAAARLDLGPLVDGKTFWSGAAQTRPAELSKLHHFHPFFWQIARSKNALTDVMRFGPDFRREHHQGVTVVFNATARRILMRNGQVTGAEICSSLSSGHKLVLTAAEVVIAAGAIENARLLLLSDEEDGSLGPVRNAIGRYLTDHPCFSLGDFDPASRGKVMDLLGFRALRKDFRTYMYALGLALNEEAQKEHSLPNMAAYVVEFFSKQDPLETFRRLVTGQSQTPGRDVMIVLRNAPLVVTTIGRKLLSSPRVPYKARRFLADATIFFSAKFVARDYLAGGRGRKFERVALHIIFEQPPHPDNRITLSAEKDRLGLN